ncbi:immunity protein Imm33 domain-containing protein [Lancefieldella rimae]|uniref:immunity protein Imm33 domain-containing protein n=1 Tax=Lancefieldella rimae TaxID=1383 RepID=UPI0028804DCB|nr:DUF2185 domain-containing protein [Lancefieldella rimae]
MSDQKLNPNTAYGGFIVSKRVSEGVPVGWTFREESSLSELNGWTVYSVDDNEEYISNPVNFSILSASSIMTLCPVLLEIFDAPYGTDLGWIYKDHIHIGFWDMTHDCEITKPEILAHTRYDKK